MSTKDGPQASRRGPYAKSAERRRAILTAAHAVFAAHGYRGGSLQDVANHAGMSQTSLLHYFPSKSDLLLAVLNWRDSITGDGTAPPDPEDPRPVLVVSKIIAGTPGQNYWLWARITWAPGHADILRVEDSEVAVR